MNTLKEAGLFTLAFVLLLSMIAAVNHFIPNELEPTVEAQARLNTFSSYEELENFINASKQNDYPQYYGWSVPWLWNAPARSSPAFTLSAESANIPVSDVPEYSTTNIQVAGVDEADIVKTDGEYIYIVSGQDITIIKAYPTEEAQIVSKIHLNGTVQGIFINGNRLAIFEDTGNYPACRIVSETVGIYETYTYITRTAIRVYDVTEKANPISTRNVTIDGNYLNSRMIGDYTYGITTELAIQWFYAQPQPYTSYSQSHSEIVLPRISDGNRNVTVQPTEIYYTNISDKFETYTTVVSVNLQNDLEEPVHKTFLIGSGSNTYVSQNNIYLTFSTYAHWNTGYANQKTYIHRIHIENGQIEGNFSSGQVPGYALNQFSMDENNGYFRIATTTGEVWSTGETMAQNHVYTLNSNMETIGKLENLAPGEKIHSARFMGNRAYLVTFKKIDPLFVLDLSDPFAPRVLGELKITGYSDYLHPYDENHIIGIGKETREGEGGNFAWYQGIKISLFDVTDVTAPRELAKYEIGDRGTDSPVLSDHKAFLFDKARNLLVIPVTVAQIDPTKYPGEVPAWVYGQPTWTGAYVFRITLEGGLEFRGGITHVEGSLEPYSYNWSQYTVKRSLYIDDVLYTLSDSKLKMNSLTTLTTINEIKLNP